MEKFVAATFNIYPLIPMKIEDNWDVNILLDYFVKLGPNSQILDCNVLGGKLLLQILITQMCHSCEAAQLQLSTLQVIPDGVEFTLLNPTKMYNHKTNKGAKKLQVMIIKPFSGHPCLCPLDTLMTYIERTKPMHQKVDKLFALVTTNVLRPATRTTLVRWAKNIMHTAGLDTQTLHSTRGATSSAGLLLGLPLDQIVSCVGWNKASTFIKHYMKPVIQQKAKNAHPTTVPATACSSLVPQQHNIATSSEESLKELLSTLPRKRKSRDMPVFPPRFDHCSLAKLQDYNISQSSNKSPPHTISKALDSAPPAAPPVSSDVSLPLGKITAVDIIDLTEPEKIYLTTPITEDSVKTIVTKPITPICKPQFKVTIGTPKVKVTLCNPLKHVRFQLGNGPQVTKAGKNFSRV